MSANHPAPEGLSSAFLRPGGFNEGYHSGYNSALARAATEFRNAALFLRNQGQTSNADSYDTCARELVGMMRCDPASDL